MGGFVDAPIIAAPYHAADHGFIAVLSLFPGRDPYWLALCSPKFAEPVLASRILALLRLHRTHPLLHPILIPTSPMPATAFFFPNGYWSDGRNTGFTRRVRAEVERIAAVLRTDHKPYVTDVVSVFLGERPSSFSRISHDLPVSDPNDECSLVTPPPMLRVDESRLDNFGTPALFAALLSSDYHRNRYLASLTEEELDDRALDAVINVFDVEEERTLAVDLGDEATITAMARLAEVMEEIKMRGGVVSDEWYTKLAEKWGGPGGTAERTRKALAWIHDRRGTRLDGLVKFGKSGHLRDALLKGRFRIGPASEYSDPSLNRAQSADELVFEHHLDPKRTKLELMSEDAKETLAELKPLRATITRRAATDAYVLCTSRRVSARLFHDFDADACLLIHDRRAFLRRLASRSREILPDWRMRAFDVRYLDSFSPLARTARPLIDKPARYQYQCEHRVIWLPPKPSTNLKPFFIELGRLDDIAELAFIGEQC